MVKPITPDEVFKTVPDEVIEAFNELICKRWSGDSAQFEQKEVVNLIAKKIGLEDTKIIFNEGYLDIESLFEEYGWEVEYDKHTFTFSRK